MDDAITTPLWRGEENLALILDSIGDALLTMDNGRRITMMNPVAERLTGWTAEAANGRRIEDVMRVLDEDTREPVVLDFDRVLAGGCVRGLARNGILVSLEGNEYLIADSAAPIRDDGDRILGVVLVVRDVTERRVRELKLEQFRNALDQTMDCVFMYRADDFSLYYVNEGARRQVGYSEQELLQMSVLDIKTEFNEESFRRLLQPLLDGTETSKVFQTTHRHKDGRRVPVEVSLQLVRDKQGVARFVTIVRDITPWLEAEVELQSRHTLFENLFKSLPGLFLILSPEFEIVGASDAYFAATMTTREALVGRGFFTVFPESPAEPRPTGAASLRASFGRVLETGATDEVGIQRYDLRRPDGAFEERYWNPSTSPVFGADGKIAFLIIRVEDVTDLVRRRAEPEDETVDLRSRMEEMEGQMFLHLQRLRAANEQFYTANVKLRQAKAEADASARAKSMFLAHMSHEIRTPMNAILGYSQLMLRDAEVAANTKSNLKIIIRSGEHLLTLLNNVLDMSKIEAGRTELNPTNFSLAWMMDSLEIMFRLRAETKALGFEIVLDGAANPYVIGDEGKLRQVLINLLGNAMKFTDRGRVRLHAALEQRGGDRLWLSGYVEDTGVGMTEAEQADLFQPFSQAKGGLNTQEGSGLGLAISREYVRLMGGDLTVFSNPGAGSKFSFELPLGRGDGGMAEKRERSKQIRCLKPGQVPPKILVADDQFENRDWLVKLLVSLGFVVQGTEDGEKALQVWKTWRPNLILMDVHMPVMDGLEATRKIKADVRGKDTVVIALTASAMEDQRIQAMKSGVDDFIPKPCDENELLEKLQAKLHIEYEYETAAGVPEASKGSSGLSREALRRVPEELVEGLRNATLNGSKNLMDKLIQQMEQAGHGETARALQELADNYDYDTLIQSLEAACLC